MLTHRPANIDVRTELRELAGVQTQQGEKQETLARCAKPRGAVSAQALGAEIEVLTDRQRKLIIEIGKKADASEGSDAGRERTIRPLNACDPNMRRSSALAEIESIYGRITASDPTRHGGSYLRRSQRLESCAFC